MSRRVPWGVTAALVGAFVGGCSGGAKPVAASPGCPVVLTANGHAAPLNGHPSSTSPRAALRLFLRVNHAAIKQSAGVKVNQDLSNLVGEFDLPQDHWALVTSPKSVVVYEHGGAARRRDFQVVIARTSGPSGWAVMDVSRCS